MKLTTEEKQYLEIYLWNDYNEKMIIKKADLKPPQKFITSYKMVDNNNLRKYPKKRIN
jgi:hypothetical protein